MTRLAAVIPYEKQQDDWKCGAACLAMAYRSFGLSCGQEEIWPHIRRDGGKHGAWTHRLAHDALQRGLSALILQARDPWALLRQCQRLRLRTIVNVQLRRGSAKRHFSLVLQVEKDHILLHDPTFGPKLRRSHDEFLELWGGDQALAPGHILVALARQPRVARPCPVCRRKAPKTVPCPVCRTRVMLAPATILGCADSTCRQARWRRLFCPQCDAYLLPKAEPAPVEERTDDMNPANDFDRFSQAFEQYRSRINEMQRAATDGPGKDQLSKLLSDMTSQHAQMLDALQKHNQQLDEQLQATRAGLQASRKKAEQQAAQRAQQPPPKPKRPKAKADQPIDPELGAKLRDQLLEEFGNRPPQPSTAGDIWQEMKRG